MRCISFKAFRLHRHCCLFRYLPCSGRATRVPACCSCMPPSMLHARAPGRGFPWSHLPAGHHYNRITVVTIGCLLWGVMTALFSVTQSLQQVRLVTTTLIWSLLMGGALHVPGSGCGLSIPTAEGAEPERPFAQPRALPACRA